MRKVITSFGVNYHQKLLGLSVPGIYKYAAKHGYDIYLPNPYSFGGNVVKLHPSWWKLVLFQHLFQQYDSVLWIDADVLICKFDKDIAEDVGQDKDFGLVVHNVKNEQIPNCGVWYLNQSCMSWLMRLYEYQNLPQSWCWWEQAALIHLLSTNEGSTIQWSSLPYEWNPHLHDNRNIPEDLRFFHATLYPDRFSAMQQKLRSINTSLD